MIVDAFGAPSVATVTVDGPAVAVRWQAAADDLLALGLMRRLAERGCAVPGDVSVVGFDNVFGADFCHPSLTTLAERPEDAGARAVEFLVHHGQSPVEGPIRVLPTHLEVRASTGPAREG